MKKFQLTSDIVAEDLGFGLILKYRRRLYTSFVLSALLIVLVGTGLFSWSYNVWPEDVFTTMLPLDMAACIVLFYWIAARYLDTATITITKQKLVVKRGPIPILKDFNVPANNISQIFHERKIIRASYRWGHRWVPDTVAVDGLNIRYVLGIVTTDKRKLVLLKDIVSESDAKALEKEIERWLGIADRPVEDELRSILVRSGFLRRITYSSWSGGFLASPLYYALLAAAFIVLTTFYMVSGEILVGRTNPKVISLDNDPTSFGLIVLATFAIAGWCAYRSWRNFTYN